MHANYTELELIYIIFYSKIKQIFSIIYKPKSNNFHMNK